MCTNDQYQAILLFCYYFIDETEKCFYFSKIEWILNEIQKERKVKTFEVSNWMKTWKGKSKFPYFYYPKARSPV